MNPITDINTIEDVLEFYPEEIDSIIRYANPKDKRETSINAYCLLLRIVEIYNGGTELDWSERQQVKYLPYFIYRDSQWVLYGVDAYYGSYDSSGLYFKSRELANDAINKFMSIYKDYLM